MTERRRTRVTPIALSVLAAVMLGLHVAAGFTENINWDEFALFQRVANMLRTGRLQGGGHAGVIELILAPFVHGCRDAVATIQYARVLWSAILLAGVIGLYRLALLLRRDREHPAYGAVLAVALFVFAFPFLRWSIQVRADQLGLAFGIWSAVALLASRRTPLLALLAGTVVGLGFLCTRKVAYFGLLTALLCLTDSWRHGERPFKCEVRRLSSRVGLCALGIGVVLGLYRLVLPHWVEPVASLTPAGSLEVLQYYRDAFGNNLYRGMLFSLKPHWLGLLLLGLASATAIRSRVDAKVLVVSWAVLGLGMFIALAHTGMFPYFWMTLGVFPAIALGLCTEELNAALPARVRHVALLAFVGVLALPAMIYSGALVRDTQSNQRQALDFVERSFAAGEYGFQLEGALFCRPDSDPFPVLFRSHIETRFSGARAKEESDALIERFRTKPVSFLLVSHMMPFFPEQIRTFWKENYQSYFGPVRVAGRRLQGAFGTEQRFEILATGRYRWLAFGGDTSSIEIDGIHVGHEATIDLDAGEHHVRFPRSTDGIVTLAMRQKPLLGDSPFYASSPIREIVGGSYWSTLNP